MTHITQIALCLCGVAACLITYLEKQNELTRLRLSVPRIVREIKYIQEENTQLKYQIQAFESPEHLMELACEAQFSHLKHPSTKEVLVLEPTEGSEPSFLFKSKDSLAVGVK